MTETLITRHATVRAAQRGIDGDDIDLIMMIGTEVEGGYFVRDKDCEAVERYLKHLMNRVRHLKGKRIVVADGRVVTIYHAGPKKERRLLRRVEYRNLSRPSLIR